MGKRELIEPHEGDKRFQRRNQDCTFGESDEVGASLRQDRKQKATHAKPRGEGDKGD